MKPYPTKNTNLYKFEILEQYHEVRHFVTSRLGGFSEGNYKGLNLGFGTDDDPEIIIKNRHALTEDLGIPLEWFVFMRQTHSYHIEVVDVSQRGFGAFSRENAIANTDAIITSNKNICLVVQVADCVPLLLLDSSKGVIAAIHAGWRGTFQEITRLTIEKMVSEFNSNPTDIIACIGPSVGPCCYETGNEIRQQFIQKNEKYSEIFFHKNNKLILDLWKANKMQLLAAGIKEENIEASNLCTNCNHDLFYSSRFDSGNTGRFVAGIMLQ
jgi:polyphenol oxidase